MKMSTINLIPKVFKNYLFYLSSEKWGKERYEAYQDDQLKKIVQHAAAHVPYYRELFKKIKFTPDQFRGRQDLDQIPILDKETVRTRQKEFIADNAQQFGITWDSTSGSTGTPLHLIIDNSTKAHKLAAVLRSYQWAGYFPGKRTFSLQSYTFKNSQEISKRYLMENYWRFNAKLLSEDRALEILEMINKIKPQIFIGYPFSILLISQIAERNNIKIHPFESIVTAGETLSEQRRILIEKAYSCKVYDFFSHHEDVSVITECRHQKKHIFESFAFNEVTDEQGNASKSGSGLLIGTGFYNYAMPLIRYNIGDNVVLDTESQDCPCGCKFRVLKEVIGRQNDYLELPDGRFLGNVLEHAVDNAKGIKLSQCIQDEINHIYINMIIDETFSEESTKALEIGLRKRIGNEIKIDFRVVDRLEKTKSGKTPFLISKIGHNYI